MKQPQQSGQDGGHVHQVQDGVGDQDIGRRLMSGLQVTAELGVHQAHPEITYPQPIRQQVTAQARARSPNR